MKKEMLINVLQPEECRIAVVEDGVLEELYVERTSHESYTGNIYKGKIVNLEPAIQAAFVDFSVGRNGFLHVSDVEPQYYHRHQADAPDAGPREPRRDRGRARGEERDANGPPPPRGDRGDDRSPPRDRPDRSERGRRDRSEPRRFGEGLVDEDWLSPPPPPRPVEPPTRPEPQPPARDRVEDRYARPGPSPSSWFDPGEQARVSDQRTRAPEVEEPRARVARPAEPYDPDLPPSRTQRTRLPSPPPRTSEPDLEEPGRSRASFDAPDVELAPPEAPAAREPRRTRGRGRPARPVEPEAPPAAEIEPDLSGGDLGPEPEFAEPPEPPRRRGGRAAIRSRGGDRPEPERPREPVPERPRSFEEDRPVEVEAERVRPAEPERPRERPREAARVRGPEPEPGRERGRSHGRAGEPGYVPRRERSRGPESGAGAEPPPSLHWSDLADELGTEPETGPDETVSAAEKLEGARRRRRRRGRRRDRPEPGQPVSADDLDPELEDQVADAEAHPAHDLAGDVSEIEGPSLMEDFDFGDEVIAEDFEEDVEALHDDLREEAAPASPDEEIDPELEEEIRREIAEIAELEREMGLRGPVEARPRRGDVHEAEAGRPEGRFTRGRGMAKPPIQEIFRRGDEVLVQVIKESIGTKGPTLSTYISIPGRYLVLMPGLNRVGVSRKIADESQRRKLREIMNELNPPKGLGFIVRTAGLERSKRELARDLAYLLRLWKVILRRIKKARTPAPIYQESDMITRTIRDIFTSEIDTIWIDEPSAFERAQEFLRVVMPRFVDRLKLYDEKAPLFHKYGIEDEIAKIQRRRVDLPEGGSIVIDQTEALVAIDVNSGNFRVENDAERTAYEMNLRAAKEIARQLRLRDLGGVIVNDFIDMREERHRRGVEKALRDAIKRDRARSKVLRMSAFGLIEMTRQRIRPSLKRSVYEDCPHCAGAGVVKTVESMSIDVMRLLALGSHREEVRRVNVSVCPAVASYLNNRKRREIARIEVEANMTIHLRAEEDAPAEHLQIECFDGNNTEVRLFPAPAHGNRRAAHH